MKMVWYVFRLILVSETYMMDGWNVCFQFTLCLSRNVQETNHKFGLLNKLLIDLKRCYCQWL
jgi:hypothetical protein